jgi:hypothetical protein
MLVLSKGAHQSVLLLYGHALEKLTNGTICGGEHARNKPGIWRVPQISSSHVTRCTQVLFLSPYSYYMLTVDQSQISSRESRIHRSVLGFKVGTYISHPLDVTPYQLVTRGRHLFSLRC